MEPNTIYLNRRSFGYRHLDRCLSIVVMREDKRNAVMCNVKVPEDYNDLWVWGKSFDNMIDFLQFLVQNKVVLGTMESHEIFEKDSETDLTTEDLKKICSTIKIFMNQSNLLN